jgi:hypothetical protein
MYSTCLFCHGRLGENDVIEHFPVGRRLAFDAAKGRLWVICPACQRWNLTPLEERWEAVEDLERRVRATTFRVSTDNIGLARLSGGLHAVRIGKPLRPELAAWRYGRSITQRAWRRLVPRWIIDGTTFDANELHWLANLTTPFLHIGVGALTLLFGRKGLGGVTYIHLPGANNLIKFTARDDAGNRIQLKPALLSHIQLVEDTNATGWGLRLPTGIATTTLTGDAAARATAILLARANWSGAPDQTLAASMRMFADAESPDAFIARVARLGQMNRMSAPVHLPLEIRLALEMATHDRSEREALTGELTALAAAWREAEEVAAIADELLLPEPIADQMRRLHE